MNPSKYPLTVEISIALLCAIVFALDAATPLGITVWVFYLLPVMLCLSQSRPLLPYVAASVSALLIIVGFFASPVGLAEQIAVANRVLGTLILFGVAYLTSRVIGERRRAAHLLWIEQGRAAIARSMMGEKPVRELADTMLQALADYTGAQVATLYRLEKNMLVPTGSFAGESPQNTPAISIDQGVAGQVARSGEAMLLRDIPSGYMRISSTIGSTEPRHVLLFPIFAEERVQGIVELGFIRRSGEFTDELELVNLVADKFGMSIRSALYRENLQELLEETRRQSEELQAQQEELRVTNEELQEQSRILIESQSTLETQQTELEQANVQLEERTHMLERQKAELQRTQRQMEAAAEELERSSRYKSEFLANMSHELRTPLNSSLILSHMLSENKAGNLNADQVRHAKTIHSANQDLLALINDILDLSKIEAGQVEIHRDAVRIAEVTTTVRQIFEPVANEQKVAFDIVTQPGVPALITTDPQRLQQILRNLLSNAFKFTHAGKVQLEISASGADAIEFAVKDTGIGIPKDKQEIIFDAFRQADGSTNRTYGGTGLGLSISKQLAQLLGGGLRVDSQPEVGSTFTLRIPVTLKQAAEPDRPAGSVESATAASWLKPMDSTLLKPQHPPSTRPVSPAAQESAPQPAIKPAPREHERVILIVEDDDKFANVLCELVRDLRFDCIHAATAGAAIRLADEHKPDAVLLDVGLPDQSGLSVLAHLKRQPTTRHIPVHMISVGNYQQTALELGAIGYAIKPAAKDEIINAIAKIEERLARQMNHILIVEDDPALGDSLSAMLQGDTTRITLASSTAEALEHLSASTFDCMVMDLTLPDESGYALLEKMTRSGKYSFPPVIVYTGRVLSREEEQRLRQYAQSIIIKGAKSPERLLDEVSLFLHRIEASLPAAQQKMLAKARQRDALFEGRKILLVEDDVRNIFALSSLFDPLGATLEIARNGKEALKRLAQQEDIDLVLMDLMMPEMDGLTAMREIRKQPQHRSLPIIALTAKAMSNDRKESLDAGANDYIAKPIDVEKLISLCRIWMPS